MSSLTAKQNELLDCIRNENPRILLASGAKRAGKTFVINLGMLGKIAEHEGEGKAFILGGYSYSSIWRNVLNDWESLLNIKIKFHSDMHFNLFGNKIYVFNGSNASSWKAVRGFTAQGAFLNEATALEESFVREVISRCSEKNAFIYMDTNPERPQHYVKKEFFDKSGARLSDGHLNIKAFTFTLDDNTALDTTYIESIKQATPKGMYTDRDILGKWVTAEGVIYDMFSDSNIKDIPNDLKLVTTFAGVDWGYKHKGVILTLGIDAEDNVWVLDEVCKEKKFINYWVDQAHKIIDTEGHIPFFADSARTEHIDKFNNAGINTYLANKKVHAGIELVSILLKNKKLFISPKCKNLIQEFDLYAWNDKTGEPIKENDDGLDALRYAVYSFYLRHRQSFKWVDDLGFKVTKEDSNGDI